MSVHQSHLLLILFVVAAFVFRLSTLRVSLRHEARLKEEGAVEHGKAASAVLALFHIGFYIVATVEGLNQASRLGIVSALGFALYLFGSIMLVVVIRLLGPLWTVKLIIANGHELVTHPLFRAIRHPNYFLNILPELIGFALTLQAYRTLLVGLPLYLIPLVIRIVQEERVMRSRFAGY